nr:class I SAM-dependent methyltransferase [Microbispora cellulosiformans]
MAREPVTTEPAGRAGRYAGLFAYARTAAERIAASPHRPVTGRAVRLRAAALALLDAPHRTPPDHEVPRTAAYDALDVLVEEWPSLAVGRLDGADVMRSRPGLWGRLMTEWPMMEYADALVAALPRLYTGTESVLEIGSGVGNATARLAPLYRERLVWTDRELSLVRHSRWPGTGRVFDFDLEPPDDLGRFDAIVGINALHCAADIARTLGRLRRLLLPGGILLLAEGNSPTRSDGTPWALDLLFNAFDGWWDRGGFRTRSEWREALSSQGYTDIRTSAMTAGSDDLGGLIWAYRPE